MGQKGVETRTRLLDATRDLMEAGGYSGAGLSQVIAASGAPRGSVYFHFPGGKDQMVGESLARAADEITAGFGEVAADGAADLVAKVLGVLGDRLEASGWARGCPVATVALDVAASNDGIQRACSAAYRSWERALRDRLAAEGREDADDLAVTVLALVEGALLLARAHRSREPLERVLRTVRALL